MQDEETNTGFTCAARLVFRKCKQKVHESAGKHESLEEGGNILRRARGLCLQQGLVFHRSSSRASQVVLAVKNSPEKA